MNVTLTLDDELVRKVRRLAADRDTTLTALIREYLQNLADDEGARRNRRAREELDRTFRQIEYRVGERTWTREQLHERS